MARNEEKHAGRLNRLWLQQLDEDKLKKNPPRPGLGSLKTASDVKKWLPSIKRDIDFYLKQSQVGCYPERLIADFSTKIENLTKEYRAYVRKLRDLEPQTGAIPWTDRPYKRKHQSDGKSQNITSNSKKGKSDGQMESTSNFVPIDAAVLEREDSYKEMFGYEGDKPILIQNTDPKNDNMPLKFDWTKPSDKNEPEINGDSTFVSQDPVENTQDAALVFKQSNKSVNDTLESKCSTENPKNDSKKETEKGLDRNNCVKYHCSQTLTSSDLGRNILDKTRNLNNLNKSEGFCTINNVVKNNDFSCETNTGICIVNTNSLNLPYSDSSGDEVEDEIFPT